MTTTRALSLLLVALPLVGACLWTTPEQAAENALPYDGDEGPEHMPGYPCLACHGEEHSPGGPVFVLAGTVYQRAGDTVGVQGAEVYVRDEAGHELTVTTNRAGNFMVRDGGDHDRGRGETSINFTLDWPLLVEVRPGVGAVDQARHMRTRVQREGSCSTCHALGSESATSAGQIFLVDDAP